MSDVPMKRKAPMVSRSIRFESQTLEDAEYLGLDVSEICRECLEQIVEQELRDRESEKVKRRKK